MKILVFSHKECWKSEASPTGWATDGGFVFHMQAIASLADEIELICFETKPKPEGEIFFKDAKLSFSTIKLVPYTGVRRKLWVLSLLITRLFFFKRKIRNADLVHTPIPSDLATLGMLLTKWMKKPLFIRHCGNWLSPTTRAEHFWKKFMIKNAGHGVACLATGGAMKPPTDENEHVKWVFSTSLLEAEISELSSAKSEIIDPEAIKLITVSRQTFNKGAWRTIEAVKLLTDKGYNIDFKIVGKGEYTNELKTRVKDLGLEQHVQFMGQLSGSEVITALKNADIFVFPSTASEGFPKAVLEALAAGLPVVTSRVSVLPRLIEDTESGFVLGDPSPEAVSEALEKIINDKVLYSQLVTNAMATARQYSLEKWADDIAIHINKEFHWELKRRAAIIK